MANLPSVLHPTDRPNFYFMEIGDLTVWYSYRTPIAFSVVGGESAIRENDWSVTTGKHLNYVNDNKSVRISGKEFETKLSAVLDKMSASL